MNKPPCFRTQEEFDAYMELLEQTIQDSDRSFCWDCLPEYKEQMLDDGRCIHPMVQFVIVDGALVGKRPT